MPSQDIIVKLDQTSGLATITFNRPDAANAINTAMWESLPRLIKKLEEDGARLIIFTGIGKYFAAGADFDDLRQIVDYASAARFWQAISAALETIAALELPTIAMVNGPCLGGGCLLAMPATCASRPLMARFSASRWPASELFWTTAIFKGWLP